MRQSIQQYLDVPADWKIRENIKHEIVLMPLSIDIQRANKKDPKSCALAQAACRIYGVPKAAIGGRWAYIPQRDGKGKYYIARMQAAPATQRAIREFDKTGRMPEFGFRFTPINTAALLKNKREYMRKWSLGLVGHNTEVKFKSKPRRIKTRTLPMDVKVS